MVKRSEEISKIQVYVNRHIKKKLLEACKNKGTTISAFVEDLIVEALFKQEDFSFVAAVPTDANVRKELQKLHSNPHLALANSMISYAQKLGIDDEEIDEDEDEDEEIEDVTNLPNLPENLERILPSLMAQTGLSEEELLEVISQIQLEEANK